MGVDPADGQVYAGTHEGLMRISRDGQVTRITDRMQDFMGFTVVGARHYLASGHPGQGQSGPGNLGLLETTDGGQTWRTLSLAGQADFHALDAAGGMIYGYSGGRLLVSADGVSWSDRGGPRLADIAVDPRRPERVLATTAAGLALSEDGGASFAVVPSAPALLLVAFPPDGGALVGLSSKGAVFASADGGRSWEPKGDVSGAPEALGVYGRDVYVAVRDGLMYSFDGGSTFTRLRQRT